jgi:hypothetical protein
MIAGAESVAEGTSVEWQYHERSMKEIISGMIVAESFQREKVLKTAA